MTGERVAPSGFSAVDETSDPSSYVRRLDATAAHDFWKTITARTFVLLCLRCGSQVLDVGCGTGGDVLDMAQLVGPSGRAVGIDASATMVAEARERAKSATLPVEFLQQDAYHLAFPDNSFDGCRVERVLQHLDDPARALGEMVRVARPGGHIVAVEPDYGAASITGGDPSITRKILNCRLERYKCGTVGRQLPQLFKALGLVAISASILNAAHTGIADESERALLQIYAEQAVAGGFVSTGESRAWLADLEQAGKMLRYRRAVPVFLVSGQKTGI